MPILEYDKDGWICTEFPYKITDPVGSIEVTNEQYEMTCYGKAYYAWRVVNGELVQDLYEVKQWTQDERLQERIKLHKATDDDYSKYARQVRLNVDMPHSQQVLDYIDQYNLQVSNTVNSPNFPQEVTYPVYQLP